jgi:hypothetical protein
LKDYSGEPRYFKASYLENHPTFPSNCAKCSKRFCDKLAKDCSGGEWSARAGKVFLCPLGALTKHDCTFGLCHDCVKADGLGTPEKRIRKPKQLEYGNI